MVWLLVPGVPSHQGQPEPVGIEAGGLRSVDLRSLRYEPWCFIAWRWNRVLTCVLGLGCFFTFMTVAEGGGRRALTRKFQDVYLPTLKANFVLWPAVQILNFRVVPIQFQIVSDCLVEEYKDFA